MGDGGAPTPGGPEAEKRSGAPTMRAGKKMRGNDDDELSVEALSLDVLMLSSSVRVAGEDVVGSICEVFSPPRVTSELPNTDLLKARRWT